MSRFEQAAVTLVEHGYHVFPCRSRGKEPITSKGFHDSSRDERRILHWWNNVTDANIGIDCGATGIVVWDIDSKHGADPAEILADRDLNGAPVVLTGEAPERDESHPLSLPGVRGAQVYFRGTLKTTGKLTIAGTEIRGAGGYVIAPPSVHPSGVEYIGDLPPVAMLPPAPAWLLELVEPETRGPVEPINGHIPKGEQHRTLVSFAGSMRRRGADADEIEAALQVMNRKRLQDPATRQEIRKIAESVGKYPPHQAVNGTHSIHLAPDVEAAALSLGELLGLQAVGMKVKAARLYGKGSSASLEIDVSNGETMTFGTLREMMRPQALIAEVAACTGATPVIKQVQCAQALTLARQVAQVVEIDTENDVAREWGRDFLDIAEILDLDITDQRARWTAFEHLAHRDPWGKGNDQRDAPPQPLILRHEPDGSLFIRTLWFERYVKSRDASVSRLAIGPRMARVGWSRRSKSGDIKATAPGLNKIRIYPFWVVPADWADHHEVAA